MYQKLTLATATGEVKEFGFLANATTAIRFRQVFHKELMAAITSIVSAAGSEGLKKLMEAVQAAETDGRDDLDLNEMDPETMDTIIKIVGSGELETVSQMAYIMYAQAEAQQGNVNMNELSVEGYLNWLDQFETMEFLTHTMDFIMLYMAQKGGTSTQKNGSAQPIAR